MHCFLYFYYCVAKVSGEKTEKLSTWVNSGQCFGWMSVRECINYLVQFFTGS